MYRIKLNNTYYDQVPESIEDVSLRRFIKLRSVNVDSPAEVIFWALDQKVDLEEADTIEKELANLFALVMPVVNDIFAFMQSATRQRQKPHSVEILGRKLSTTNMLAGKLPYWAYVATKNIISTEAAARPDQALDVTNRYPDILAHYLYAAFTGNAYDEGEAEKFIDITNTISMVPAIQLGNFFLMKQKALLMSKRKSSKAK